MAAQVVTVSGERIAEELRKLFASHGRANGLDALVRSSLWAAIFPEVPKLFDDDVRAFGTLGGEPSLPLALAVLIGALPGDHLDGVADRLKLSNAERDRLLWLAAHRTALTDASELPRHQLKPLLAHPGIGELLTLHLAMGCADAVDYCQARLLEWPSEVLDPEPVITGEDLKELGLTPGPRFKEILEQVRAEQLDERIMTRDAAVAYVRTLLNRDG
jgi:tRNA nucleotidyltransferase/poly(A) polymerase